MRTYLFGITLLSGCALLPVQGVCAQELQSLNSQQLPPLPPAPPRPVPLQAAEAIQPAEAMQRIARDEPANRRQVSQAAEQASRPISLGERPLQACLDYMKDPANARYPPEAHLLTANSAGDQIRAAIVCTLSKMRLNRRGLEGDLKQQRGRQTSFDSTLIALGIGTSAAAFLGGSARLIGSLAIGSGGLAQYRSYYGNEARGSAYLRALAASRCVNSAAQPLLAARPEELWKEIHALKRAIGIVQAGLASLPASATADPAASDQADAAARAISAANTAIAALNAESSALIYAPSIIDQAHDQINNFRDSKKQRSSAGFDVASVQAALSAGIDASSDAVTKMRTASAKLADAAKAATTAQAKVDPESVGETPAIAQDEDATNAATANEEPSPEEIAGDIQTLTHPAPPAAPPGMLKGLAAMQFHAAAAAKATKASLVQMNRLISALNQTSVRALDVVPEPSNTKINTNILACTAGLVG